jgi:cobalt-zinc-cadmium efflux system outer membrane protein
MKRSTRLFVLLCLLETSLSGRTADAEPPPLSPASGSPGAETEVALPNPLTLDDAVRIFHERGFDLLIADAAVASARGDLTISRAYQNPAVSGGAGPVFTYDPSLCARPGCSDVSVAGSVSDQGLLFDQVIGKRRLRVRAARAALEAARLSRSDAERTLAFQLKQQFAQGAVSALALDFARETAAKTAQTFQLVDLRYKAGAVSEADVARAETDMLEAQQAVNASEQALAQAKANLVFLIGVRSPIQEFDIDTGALRYEVPEPLRQATAESLLALALQRRPDLAAQVAQMESSAASLDLAKRQRIPDISVGAGYSQLGYGQDSVSPPALVFSLSFTLPLLYQYQGEIAKAEADLRAQSVRRDKIEAQVGSDVATAFATFVATRSRVERMEGRLLDRARRARDLVEFQYKKGAASLLELLDAERTFIATNVEYRQNLADYWSAVFQVEQATGTELRP